MLKYLLFFGKNKIKSLYTSNMLKYLFINFKNVKLIYVSHKLQ